MEWNEEIIARLRALWAEGLSTAEIGRRLNVSKNAVVGKVHRLHLPPRPSPIRRAPPDAVPRPRPVPAAPAEPALPTLAVPAFHEPAHHAAAHRTPAEPPRPVLRSVPSVSAGVSAGASTGASAGGSTGVSAGGRVTDCCWPIGEPGTKGFRFCDAPSAPGRPYCAEHVAVAYVKVRDRREEAA